MKAKRTTIKLNDSTPTMLAIVLVCLAVFGGIYAYVFIGGETAALAVFESNLGKSRDFIISVADQDGKALAGANVKASFANQPEIQVTTDQNGTVSLTGGQGDEYDLEILRDGYQPSTISKVCCSNETIALIEEMKEEVILRLHGSNTIGAKLAPSLAKGYLKKIGTTDIQVTPTDKANEVKVLGVKGNTKYVIEIAAHGSSTGFKSLSAGSCDIGMASRKIKDKETDLLKPLGDMTSTASEHVLALDGIAVIVNPANPIEELSVSQVSALFNGEVDNWKSINGKDESVHVYARDDRSGTYDTFKSLVLRKTPLSKSAKRFESNAKLSDEVALDKFGIGFTSLPNIRNAKALRISDGAAAILPNFFTVATEDYGLSRRLYLYSPSSPSNKYTNDFIRFALASNGQEIVAANNLVDLNIKTFISRIASNQKVQDKKVFGKYLTAIEKAKRLSLNFRFERDGFQLDNRGHRDLDRIVDFLKNYVNQDSRIILIGFTDNIGDYAYNYKLALKRAETVAKEFQARGIAFIDTISAGEEVPVASNETPAGQKKNRRVEVWFNAQQGVQLSSKN